MQKITPFLWFDGKAEEAVHFYTAAFKNSSAKQLRYYSEGGPAPAGSVMSAEFELEGLDFIALNAGPKFRFTPAISFFVSCASEDELSELWEKLSVSGEILMPLDKYSFSDKFGWLQDKFGITWQLNLGERKQKIAPAFLFCGPQHGKAAAAIHKYTYLFNDAAVLTLEKYGLGENGTEGTVKYAVFTLHCQEFMAMDSNYPHAFNFTPAISLFVSCQTQQEVDNLWEQLSEGGQKQPCGWLQDEFGISWQIVPDVLGNLLQSKEPGRSERVMRAMMQMSKLDIKALEEA